MDIYRLFSEFSHADNSSDTEDERLYGSGAFVDTSSAKGSDAANGSAIAELATFAQRVMLFKKFGRDEVSSIGPAKSSVARGVRASLCETYPYLEKTGLIDVLIPKKETIQIAKCHGHIQIVVVAGEPLFFTNRDGPWCPTLRLLHKYPDMMAKFRVDTGAIKFVLSGANIMCPGLTSPGATIHDEVGNGQPVAIFAEGKVHAIAIGKTMMSTEDIRTINKGHCVESLHFLTDGLWKTTRIL